MKENKPFKFKRAVTKNIINNSFNASAWIFFMLIQLGELTIEAFLNPSIYADFPSTFYAMPKNAARKKIKFKEASIRQSLWRLKKQGFLEKRKNKYLLTKTGNILAQYALDRKKSIDEKWDKKFRVVIFDIPESKRDTRNWLRQELYLLNYRKLQESVFIGKYSLTKDLVKEIKNKKISNYVNYLLAEKVYRNIL
jgi:hypothetical protein